MRKFNGLLLVSDFDNTLVYTEEALQKCVDMPPVSDENRSAIDNRVAFFYIIAFQYREQRIVDEIQQLVSGHSMTVAVCFRPISPSEVFGNDGFVVVLVQFPVIFFGIVYFQEKHPYHLLNSLSIAVHTCIHTHNITDPFYKT